MNRRLIKDNKQRCFFDKTESYRTYSKAFFYNQKIAFKARWLHLLKTNGLTHLNAHSSRVRAHNFCLVSGRAHSVYRKFKMARMVLRDQSFVGAIPGVTKASW